MLRDSNPAATSIRIRLSDFRGEERANWQSLLHVISTRANLEKVILQDSYRAERRTAPADLVRSILQATQQNTAIQSVHLTWLRLPTYISTFVDNASSITSFRLYDCDMEPAEREQGTSDLAAALQRNTNIECLELWKLDDLYTIPILEGLGSNVSLKTFIFTPISTTNMSDATSHALQRLLESTTSILRFELITSGCSGNTFHPIAQAIAGSECVSELKFLLVGFLDRSTVAQFRSILQNKRNLTSLCLQHCTFNGEAIHGDIVSILLRPDSQLRCFEFQSHDSLEGEFPGIHFKNLLQAIQTSKLERFNIGTIQTQQQLQTLIESISLICIRELEIAIGGQILRENARQTLLLAIKNNFSLRSVKARNFFDDNDKQRLAFYANRNKSLDKWVDNPETVEQQKVWPNALGLAERAGPNALFRGLRLVLGSDYVHLPGARKRKRTQYYSPS